MGEKRLPLVLKLCLALLSLGSLSLFVMSASGYQPLATDLSTPQIPESFKLLTSAVGVSLYQKPYAGGYPDYVQVVGLNLGARLVLLHGDIQELRDKKGVFGGNDARFTSKTLAQYWKQLTSNYRRPFCVTNGQFFYMLEYPTRLPFPLKVDGEIISDGYEDKNFSGQKLILELWDDRADIRPLTKESLYGSSAPNILGGLAEDARKSPDKYVARTFIGVRDRGLDGKYRTVLIFNTQTARQSDAAEVLRSFGAAKVMMLDGGGSTQLTCKKTDYIASERLIPQAIGVLAGSAYQDGLIDKVTQRAVGTKVKQTAEVEQATQASITETASLEETRASMKKKISPSPDLSATEIEASQTLTNTLTLAAAEPSQSGVHIRDMIWIPIVIILLAPLVFYIIQEKRYH